MPAKVFISCGQSGDPERMAARENSAWLKSKGFDPYIAILVQSIPDLNKGIIDELKRSDYFLFINFRRELLSENPPTYRGSLYTNQELAIAYALGFQEMIFLNQKHVERTGMFGTIVSNSPEFETYSDVLPTLKTSLENAKWVPSFSRNLVPKELMWSEPVLFGDHTIWQGSKESRKFSKTLILSVANRRADRGAISTTLRLKSISDSRGNLLPVRDSTPLKVTYQTAFDQIIWPESTGLFDLLSLDLKNLSNFYLNSTHDHSPRRPVITETGVYEIVYQCFADGFPIADIKIELRVTGDPYPVARILS